MLRLLIVLPLLALAGCVSERSIEPTPEWRIEFEGGVPEHMEMEWLETARFQDSRDAWRAMRGVAENPNSAGMGYIFASPNLMLRTERDETAKVYHVRPLRRDNFIDYADAHAGSDALLVKAVHNAPSFYAADTWDPIELVKTANVMLALGEAESVRVLERYLHLQTEWSKGFRDTLFDPSPGNVMAIAMVLWDGVHGGVSPRLGGGLPGYLEGKLELIHFIGGLPFATCQGFNLGGLAESAMGYIDRVQNEGKWRQQPLAPVDNPFAAYLEFEKWLQDSGREAKALPNGRWLQFLRTQCLRCVEIESANSWNLLLDNSVIPMLSAGAEAKGLRWSAQHEWYELPD